MVVCYKGIEYVGADAEGVGDYLRDRGLGLIVDNFWHRTVRCILAGNTSCTTGVSTGARAPLFDLYSSLVHMSAYYTIVY